MLKDIRLHLDPDDSKQSALEREHAEAIQQRFRANLRAFNIHIPNLASQLNSIATQNISIFCNQNGQANLVDFGTGRTFYGLNPYQEVKEHVKSWVAHPFYVDFSEEETELANELNFISSIQGITSRPILKHAPGTLVIFGLGGGYHLPMLLKQANWRHIIIYEPELQYFKSSALMTDWCAFFELAKQNKTQVFILTGKDGSELTNNISELQEHDQCSGFYLYNHYHHPVFDAITLDLRQRSWQKIKGSGLKVNNALPGHAYKPLWTAALIHDEIQRTDDITDQKFKNNLAAFKQYFPDIYSQFSHYESQYWHPVYQQSTINLIDITDGTPLYQEPQKDGQLNKQNFVSHPNKDGLILGFTGKKLKKYLHYQYVEKTVSLLEKLQEKKGALPKRIKSLIMFGLGCGYQLEALLNDHSIDKLFICEPNRDFFYASLFAIDWAGIIREVDKHNRRLYINVGDDGQNLFRDLLHQFYAIGPYNLANTYFYQTYHNAELETAVANLREQLQVVISMGEYFDHARFGIAHTREMLSRGTHCLVERADRPLHYDIAEVPVFVVGNGPSLDNTIALIQEWRDSIIVISCGTALMPLYKAGITPDFHAEIEQNRSTFDWCSRVGDFDYLKQITLISCNGIHPDTCDLFKQTLIAFKEGESSTVSAIEVLGKHKYAELQFAFPTVSNLVINLSCELGFKQLYLIGVDLGFVDDQYHHSKNSGYYTEEGTELYDYREDNNTAIRTPGNFRPFVHTKYEFKVSKTIIEQALAKHPTIDCFNTSDGAKIAGSMPLAPEFVLISSSHEHKSNAVDFICNHAFRPVSNFELYKHRFDQRFVPDVLRKEFRQLQTLVAETHINKKEIERLIERQKTTLFESYQTNRSLLFYLFYGSTNYTNAFLSKLIAADASSDDLKSALDMWKSCLEDITKQYLCWPEQFDTVSSFAHLRISQLTKNYTLPRRVTFDTGGNESSFKAAYFDIFPEHTSCDDSMPLEQVLFRDEWSCAETLLIQDELSAGSDSFTFVGTCTWEDVNLWQHLAAKADFHLSIYCYPKLPFGDQKPFMHPIYHPRLMSLMRKNLHTNALYVPKLTFTDKPDDKSLQVISAFCALMPDTGFFVFDQYLVFPLNPEDYNGLATDSKGSRAPLSPGPVSAEQLTLVITEANHQARLNWLAKQKY